jgi:heme/copper-type cytochrome/quinol oxidase subunit 2
VHIDWATLATVAVVAAAGALTIVLLISFAVVALSRSVRRADGPDAAEASVTHDGVGTAIAALCVLAAGLIVCYGLYLIIA